MSKSKNNGVDPLVLIDEYSTDALRYTLIREVAGAGQDITLQLNRKVYNQRLKDRAAGTPPKPPTPGSKDNSLSESVEGSRNFTNKLWNASRFVLMNLEGNTPEQLGSPDIEALELCDRWILSRYHQVTKSLRNNLDNFSLGEGAKQLYEFIWGDFCDLYIELVKYRLQGEDAESKLVAQQTLALVLEGTLKLLHPFMPHITEEIWHTVVQKEATGQISLALETYPTADESLINPDLESQFELLISTIRTVRNLRTEAGIKPGEKIEAMLQSENDRERTILTAGQIYIQNLARIKILTITDPTAIVEVAPPIAAVQPPIADPAVNPAVSVRDRKAWGDRTWLEKLDIRDLSDDLLEILSGYSKIARPLWSLALLWLGFNVIRVTFDSVHNLPLLPDFLEVIGFFYTIFYTKNNLLTREARTRSFAKLKQLKIDLFGGLTIDSDAIDVLSSEIPIVPEATAVDPIVDLATALSTSADGQMFTAMVGTVQVLIPLTGLVDISALKAKLEKDLARAQADAQGVKNRLSNQKFVAQAPEDVVQGAKNALAEAEKQAELIQARLALL
jgi:valyl-tRNA synthetase